MHRYREYKKIADFIEKIGFYIAAIYLLIVVFCLGVGLFGVFITMPWPIIQSFFAFLFNIGMIMIVLVILSFPVILAIFMWIENCD